MEKPAPRYEYEEGLVAFERFDRAFRRLISTPAKKTTKARQERPTKAQHTKRS